MTGRARQRKGKTQASPAKQFDSPLLPAFVEPFEYPAEMNPFLLCVDSYGTRASRATISGALAQLARIASGDQVPPESFRWHALRYPHTRLLRRDLATRYAPGGANVKLTALRAVLREAWRLEWLETDAYRRASQIGNVPGWPELAGRYVPAPERAQLLRAAHAVAGSASRDAALVALLMGTGIRRVEAARLDLRDVDLVAGEVRIRGKGQRRRGVDAMGSTLEALAAWVEVRGRKQGPFFYRYDRWGTCIPSRLSPHGVAQVVGRLAAAAELERLTPHDLRRTVATDLLLEGVDVLVVSQILGHAKVETTRKYDRRPAQVRRRALGHLQGVA